MSDDIVSELFPPAPGGLVDTARRGAVQAQPADTVMVTDGPVPYEAVRVRPEAPDTGSGRTVTLSAANPVLPILGQDGQRRSAVVIAVDNDVYLATDLNAAQQAAGVATATGAFYLPKGIPVTIAMQGQVWAACTTTASNSRVSVLVSKDSAP